MADEASNLPENVPNHQASGVETQGGREGRVKHQRMGLRYHMGSFLLYSTRNFNSYLIMTSKTYLIK